MLGCLSLIFPNYLLRRCLSLNLKYSLTSLQAGEPQVLPISTVQNWRNKYQLLCSVFNGCWGTKLKSSWLHARHLTYGAVSSAEIWTLISFRYISGIDNFLRNFHTGFLNGHTNSPFCHHCTQSPFFFPYCDRCLLIADSIITVILR